MFVLHINTNYITPLCTACTSGQTKASSRYLYDDSGKSCDQLISSTFSSYDTDLISVCKRWMGDSHPDLVTGSYVTYCEEQSDGTLKYTVDACCEGNYITVH